MYCRPHGANNATCNVDLPAGDCKSEIAPAFLAQLEPGQGVEVASEQDPLKWAQKTLVSWCSCDALFVVQDSHRGVISWVETKKN